MNNMHECMIHVLINIIIINLSMYISVTVLVIQVLMVLLLHTR